MSLAYISYIDDNNGYLAPLGVYPKNFGANPNIADGNFYGILMPYLNDNRKGDYTLLLGIVQPPSQYPKYVQFCPSNSNLPNIVSNSAYPSYGFNKWAVITQFPAKYSQLTSISKTIYLYDGIKTSSNSGGASISGDIPLSSTSNSAPCWYAHPGGANFAFMDGHASFVSVKQSNDTDWYAWRLSGGWKYLW